MANKLSFNPCSLSCKHLSLLLLKSYCLLLILRCAGADWLMDCGNCHCKWNSGKKTADCRNLSLSGVPEYLSPEVQVLDLSHNHIFYLEENAFSITQLQNLQKLLIRNGTLKHIHQQSFNQLQILIELDLSNNLLRELLPNVFDCLSKVRAILLNGNLIQTIPQGVFRNLKYLHKIELKRNRLIRIDSRAFEGVPLLSQIYLDNNELTKLKVDSFQSLGKLTALSLAENPWNCTCDLQLFRDFVIDMNLYTPPTSCHYPLQLRGRLWIEDQPEAFACKPKIVYPALSTSINTSKENVTLICRVHGSPNTVIAWDYNNQVYETRSKSVQGLQKQRVYIEMLRENEPKVPKFGHNVFVSRLTIVNAKKTDEGVYTCLAENPGGKDSVRISVVVQKDLQRIPLIDTNLFAIICLIAMGFLSMSILLSLVTCLIFKRFKPFHPIQHSFMQPISYPSQQLGCDDVAGTGISALSSGVAQGKKIVLDPLSAANGTASKNYTLFKTTSSNENEMYLNEPNATRKYEDVSLNSNQYFGYLDNQAGPTSSRDQGFYTDNKQKYKLDESLRHFDVKSSSHSTGSSKKNIQIEEQPDLLPSTDPAAFVKVKSNDEKQETINPRSKYNTNVQKYLKEKYGSVRINGKSTKRTLVTSVNGSPTMLTW
ncbi:leucine-rich repeat-containing protein 24 [Drosophila gunungcola]|uniref:leucine-rich repeat-containing protein 24 n=1 Tax=Drosophila gunungcola TaxID=103775 RepID=UPI0022DFAE4D|nr:leucine-rich repeat-containing protein 24 [Drosophila gunungcola]XP_052852863.1 leucine-rich repeat-containing protein 24 [Drosophila gunungcola]XP_052852864.1 leucine-rich repeat-containing protein 24 [Drosophila gunungcola]XP_052852865.1 leucine-rich repeat-containing protein 24 [Drosophila gunungcola]XP_052852866.1 leucine-rich repeat-containing protein 24 [Drosophila gunungcola]XP_052852867.1 leucine-rich repeat-containing protein 24 [Drosophila gunungcola]XP_052852868.1 leucine-rich r